MGFRVYVGFRVIACSASKVQDPKICLDVRCIVVYIMYSDHYCFKAYEGMDPRFVYSLGSGHIG